MAQFSLVVGSADDISEFTSNDTITFDASTYAAPVVRSATQEGWLRYGSFSSGSLDIVMRAAFPNTGSATTRNAGPAALMQASSSNSVLAGQNGVVRLLEMDEDELAQINAAFNADHVVASITALFYSRLKVDYAAGTLQYREWDGAIGDEPSAWLIDASSFTFPYSSGGVGTVCRGLLTGGHLPISEIYVGTDGDPAPTGPIAPPIWTTSMFAAVALAATVGVSGAPTLSSPGVIDITANSARPQVTLTY